MRALEQIPIANDGHAQFWANKVSDAGQVNGQSVGPKAMNLIGEMCGKVSIKYGKEIYACNICIKWIAPQNQAKR